MPSCRTSPPAPHPGPTLSPILGPLSHHPPGPHVTRGSYGIDTMDSCNPTRIARHGMLLTRDGPVKIKQLKHATDYGPIDPRVATIRESRSYLHHLFKQHEPLFMTLASQHNLLFMNWLMADLRRRILADEI